MLPVITIVNQRRTKEGEYIGRPSPLGNPFSSKSGTLAEFQVATVEEAIGNYAMWLEQQIEIEENQAVITELNRLITIAIRDGALKLRCWCAPGPCHGDVIKMVLMEALTHQFNVPLPLSNQEDFTDAQGYSKPN